MSAEPSFNAFLNRATRYHFCTAKGGVGKTSLACATAIALGDRGKRVLIVSTDPASNLDEVLKVELDGQPRHVPGALTAFDDSKLVPLGFNEPCELAALVTGIRNDRLDRRKDWA